MEILVNNTRENDDDQTVFFTLTDDSGTDYRYHADVPKGAGVEDNASMRGFLRCIRVCEYPFIQYAGYDGVDDLAKIEACIAHGMSCGSKTEFKHTWE